MSENQGKMKFIRIEVDKGFILFKPRHESGVMAALRDFNEAQKRLRLRRKARKAKLGVF